MKKGDIVYNEIADEFCRIKEIGEKKVEQVSLKNRIEIVTPKRYLSKI